MERNITRLKGCKKNPGGGVGRRNNPRRKRELPPPINHSNQLTTAYKNRWVNFFQVFPYGRVSNQRDEMKTLRGSKKEVRRDLREPPRERVHQTPRGLVGCL